MMAGAKRPAINSISGVRLAIRCMHAFASAIYILAVANLNYPYGQFIILNRVDDAIVPLPDTIPLLS
jgi:hypothetical protein